MQVEISSVREENHTKKKIFTSYRRWITYSRRKKSLVTEDISSVSVLLCSMYENKKDSFVTTSSAAEDSFFGCVHDRSIRGKLKRKLKLCIHYWSNRFLMTLKVSQFELMMFNFDLLNNGQLASKKSFLAYFIRFGKETTLYKFFFNSSPFSSRKLKLFYDE
jgi:hypothetical protein